MEDKNELSDIVLEKDEGGKAQKFKQLLIGAAILVLLFLAVIIIMRALNKPEKTENDSRLVLPPEPTVVAQKAPETKDDQLFKQVPIIEEESKKESFEEMVKKLKEKEIKRSENTPVPAVSEPMKEPAKEELTTVVPNVEKTVTPKTEDVKQVFKEATPPKVETKVATPVKVTPTPKNSVSTGLEATAGTYIQVAATSQRSPDAKYLKTLESKSYSYRLYKTLINGKPYIKILIGPYASNAAAKEALTAIKQDLNANAFIFRVP